MKKMMIVALAFAFCAGTAAVARAQAPTIAGINDYDGTTPTENNYYWSIYGTTLSTRTGGPSGFSSTVLFEYYVTWNGNYVQERNQEAGGGGYNNTPTYWYESPGQINFYFAAYDQAIQYNGTYENFVPDGTAYVLVTNSNYQNTGWFTVTYQP